MECRSCGSSSLSVFLDLGKMPLPDALLRPDQLSAPEDLFRLEVALCADCALVQLVEEEKVAPQRLFIDNYLYFSSYSDHLLRHAGNHANRLVESRNLGPESLVIELASNDGYLLRRFVERGIGVLGIDPAPQQAAAARASGVPTMEAFFGPEVAEDLRAAGKRADVVIANNVLAHVPDLNGFVAGIATVLADDGIVTIENPYVRELIDRGAFDTIYHEHFCYFSCLSIDALLRRNGLWLNDVEFFPDLHGGTLRWTAGRVAGRSSAVTRMLREERQSGIGDIAFYRGFATRVESMRKALHDRLSMLRRSGATVAGYGAAAKGTIMLNHAGVGTDLVEYVVDRNEHKHGMYMPGTHQPIEAPEVLLERMPDYVLLLSWNFAHEIAAQQREYLERGGRFIVPVPELHTIAA